MLYNDPLSNEDFEVFRVEGQDHERSVWKGYHLHHHEGKYLLLDGTEQSEVPYNMVWMHNITLTSSGKV